MADFEITAPDGRTFVITAPEGATQEQVLKYAQSQFAPPQKIKPDDPGVAQSMLIGAGRTVDRLGKGMKQMYLGATGDDAGLAALKAAASEDDRTYKPLQEAHPFVTAFGEAAPSMLIPGGGATTLGGNMLRMGLSAGIPAALEYGTAAERAQRGGAAGLTAGLAPGVIALGGGALKTAKSFVEPLYASGREAVTGRLLNRIAGDRAPGIAAKLSSAAEIVPGSAPTAAQVAESGGISALERMVRGVSPEQFGLRDMQQSSARLNALRDIAGDDMQIAALKKAREVATSPAYSQAKNAVYAVDPELARILARPNAIAAGERAQKIAGNADRPFQFTTTTNAPFAGVGGAQPITTDRVSGHTLQDLKMAFDAMLKDPASGIAGVERNQAMNTRNAIVNWMEGANPEFKAARQTYAQMSQPINQMEVGQELLTKLRPALSEYGALGRETGATFAKQLRDSDQMVRTATGFKGAPSLEDLMGPQKMGALTAIANDLGRKANMQDLGGTVNSDTFQKLAMSNIAAQSGMPSAVEFALSMPGVSRAMKWVYRDSDAQMQKLIADVLLNPHEAGRIMSSSTAQALLANNPKAAKLLQQSGYRAGVGLGTGAGALSQQ